MARILIIEDHENIALSLSEYLRGEGFEVSIAGSVATANAEIAKIPDLIVLDWMLPDGQGIDFLKALRNRGNHVPVIFLTARAELFDRVLGLELGANDYLTKPFESRELLARIRVQLRSKDFLRETDHSTINVGGLRIDRSKHKVFFNDIAVELVKKEFELLCLFAEAPEKVFSREEILNKVWGYDVFPTTRTVDTHVLQLRQKLSDTLIETVRAVGYRLCAN